LWWNKSSNDWIITQSKVEITVTLSEVEVTVNQCETEVTVTLSEVEVTVNQCETEVTVTLSEVEGLNTKVAMFRCLSGSQRPTCKHFDEIGMKVRYNIAQFDRAG